MSSTDAFLDGLLQGLGDLFEPIVRAAESEDAMVTLLRKLGWTLDPAQAAAPAQITAIASDVANLVEQGVKLAQGEANDDDAMVSAAESKALGDVIDIAQKANALSGVQTLPDAFRDPRFAEKLLDLLVYDYLAGHKLRFFAVARFIGLLDEKEMPAPTASTFARPYLERRLDFTRIETLVTDPAKLPAEVYGWGTPDFEADTLLRVLEMMGLAFGLRGSDNVKAGLHLYWDSATIAQQAHRSLVMPIWTGISTAGGAMSHGELDLVVVPLPPKNTTGTPTTKPEGLALFPRFDGDIAATVPLADGVTLGVQLHIEDEGLVRAELRPSGLEAFVDASVTDIDDVSGTVRVDVAPTDPFVVVGAKESSRLEIVKAHGELGVELKLGEPRMHADVGLDKATIVIDLGEGDGFLQKLLGGAPQQLDLGFGAIWSTQDGFRFNGTATLRLELSVHLDLAGIVQIDTVHLVLGATSSPEPGMTLEVSVTGGLSLGPFAAQVDRIGVTMNLVKSATDHKGALGDLDLRFGFKPPNGLGFVVHAGPVVGGGYASFDFEKQEYAGILDLEVAEKFAIKAIGVLSTKMPDGRPGFSMMLIVTAEFPPIQLSYGFTLNGVGGAIGINRTMNQDYLRAGIHTGALESILFPPDPVAHANQVISDIKQGFPLADGRFVFGPMLKIGWASIIALEVGVMLELPMPIKLALLGRLSCILPDSESGILVLRLDMAGFVDFGTGDISVDADLVDSKLLTFPLTGGFALRANVGASPMFALSAGGFHPRFTPPPSFPKLARIGLAIGDDNPRLRLGSYFALTTNTVQTGALIDFYASADFGALGSFTAAADLGFDTLIHFSPFDLEAEIYGHASIKRNGDDLCSADLDLLLTGPTPWHATGHAIVHFLGDHALAFDRTFGPDAQPAPLPPTNVADLVRKAIGSAEAWGAVPPDGDHQLVTLRDIGPTAGVLLHPRAELTVHQRVAPVDTAIAKFGEGPIAGPTTISIDGVSIPGVATDGVDPIDDAFAPAQFFELTDDQKLTRPSFERLPAGRRLKTSSFSTGTSQGADQHYVTITVDDPRLRPGDDRNGKLVDAYRVDSGLRVAMAELTGGGLETPTRYVSPSQGTAVAEPRYAVAGRRDLEPTGTYATYTDAAAAQRDDAATAIVGMHEAR